MAKRSTAKNPKAKRPRAQTGLDAAARVLAEAGSSLSARQMVEIMVKKRDGKTDGQTPHATISSAVLRDIKAKKNESRFRKAAPGKFRLTPDAGRQRPHVRRVRDVRR